MRERAGGPGPTNSPQALVATASAVTEPRQTELAEPKYEDLYKIAVDEYRFNVNLGWDRQKFFVTLNLLVAGAVPGILKLSESNPLNQVAGAVLLLGCGSCLLGIYVVWKGHTYYQNSRQHLQALERRLGLSAQGLGLATTEGMRRGHLAGEAESSASASRGGWRGLNVVKSTLVLLALMALYDLGLGLVCLMGWLPVASKEQPASTVPAPGAVVRMPHAPPVGVQDSGGLPATGGNAPAGMEDAAVQEADGAEPMRPGAPPEAAGGDGGSHLPSQ